MIKKHYLKELEWNSLIKLGDNNFKVRQVQEWINLYCYLERTWKTHVKIDGDFGPATLEAVKQFQAFKELEQDGVVGKKTFASLSKSLKQAFTLFDVTQSFSIRQYILEYAIRHLANVPRELSQNTGPWVRSYMDGNEGQQ